MRRATLTAALLCALVAGCGGGSGDLLAIDVTGGPGGTQRLVIASDGRARCNGSELAAIASERLIDARELERDVYDLAKDGENFESGARGIRSYSLRTDDGSVRWREGARGLPRVLSRAQLLALQLGRELC